jgi:hypothetical protein
VLNNEIKARNANMSPDEFSNLKIAEQNTSNRFHDGGPKFVEAIDNGSKTLLYGYNSDRNTHHVYQDDNQIHLVVYNHQNEVIKQLSDVSLPVTSIMPDKRLYAEACDFKFCMELQEAGVLLPFTNYNYSSYQKHEGTEFIGRTLEDLGIDIPKQMNI